MSSTSRLSILALSIALLLPTLAVAQDAAETRIRALTEPPAHDAWDAKVKLILAANYDLDGSGVIDKAPEVDSIPCGTWKAMDEAVFVSWNYGIRLIYGYESSKIWVGDAIGFSEVVRVHSDGVLLKCGLDGMSKASGGGTTTGGGAVGNVAERVRAATPGNGGSSDWDTAVKPILVGAYDTNGSGSIDTTGEVIAIPCDVVKALDDRVKEKWGYGIRTIYGFEADKLWVGSAVGFAESIRGGADVHFAGCLAGGSTSTTPAPSTGSTAATIRAFPGGGSSEWDAKVKGVMVSTFDANGSGAIDTAVEISSIGCDVWTAIDSGVKQQYSYGVRPIYGFQDGYSFIGYALGFSESQRKGGDTALVGCGLDQ